MARPASIFADAEVLLIRQQFSMRTLDVKAWADAKACALETVRRVARGETHRHVVSPRTDEPAETDLAAMLGRLQTAADALPPQPREVDSILEELRGKASE